MAHVKGFETKLGIGTGSPVTTQLNFINANFTKNRPVITPQGGDGNLDPVNTRARYGVSTISGSVTLEPTATELSVLLPWIFGATASMTSYPLGSTFVGNYLSVDVVSKVLDYDGVKVASAVIESVPNQPMLMTLNLIGLTETISNAGSFPSLTPDASTNYFVLTDAVITVNSVTTCTEYIRITIDNGMTTGPFTNCSTGPSEIIALERTITVDLLTSYGNHSALYAQAETGWATVITWTNGNTSLAMTMAKVMYQHQSPSAANVRDIVKLPLVGRAMRTSGAAALATVLDHTP